MYNRPIEGFNKKFNPLSVRASIETDGVTEQLGIIPLRRAFEIADENSIQVVGVSDRSTPPVVKIMDYGKFKYEQQKREKEQKKKQTVVETKIFKLRPKIDQHDLDIKVNQMADFLKEGNKVSISLIFRGREIVHPDIGHEIIKNIIEHLKDFGSPESRPMMEGKSISVLISPGKRVSNGGNSSNNGSAKSQPTVERITEKQQPLQERPKPDSGGIQK